MISPHHIPNLPAGTAEVVRRFVMSLAGVLEAIGRAFNANPRPPVDGRALLGYLQRLRTRFMVLWPRLIAGEAPRVRAKREQVGRKAREKRAPAAPRLRLPGRKAWLASEIGWWGRGFARQLEALFNDPEAAALIAGSPQAQRLLRPFCRMLAITAPCIPPLPARQRPARARPAKPKRPTRREREAIPRYPNLEGQPMRLLPKKLPRD